MNIINHIPLAALITSVTSTLLLFVWKRFQSVFMRTDPKMIYIMLRFICITYILPFGYVVALFTCQVWLQGELPILKMVFLRTDIMEWIIRLIIVIWFVKAYRKGKKQYISKKNLLYFLEDNIPVAEYETIHVFEQVCTKLHIRPNKIALFINPLTNTPLIVSAWHPQIILPEQDYTQEELELIFYHELAHYKHHDLIYKSVTSAISIVHCINPFISHLEEHVEIWSECMADVSALEMSGKLPYAREYYDKILSIVPSEKNPGSDKLFYSALYMNEQEVIMQRITFMTHYQHSKIPSKLMTALIAVLFLSISMTTAFVSGKAIAGVMNLFYRHTELKINETRNIKADGLTELTCWEEELEMDGMKSVVNLDTEVEIDGVYMIKDLKVGANTRSISGMHKVTSSQKIKIGVTLLDFSKHYLIGIIDDIGNVRYIEGTGALEHTFTITKDSNYYIFVQNNSADGTDLNVRICFCFEDINGNDT